MKEEKIMQLPEIIENKRTVNVIKYALDFSILHTEKKHKTLSKMEWLIKSAYHYIPNEAQYRDLLIRINQLYYYI